MFSLTGNTYGREVCKEKDKDHSTSTPFSQYKSIYSDLNVPGMDLLQVDLS